MSQVETFPASPHRARVTLVVEPTADRSRLRLLAAWMAVAVLMVGAGIIVALAAPGFFSPWGFLLCVLGAGTLAVAISWYFKPNLWMLYQRELGSMFLSPIAYLVLLGMAAFNGLNYWWMAQVLTEPRFAYSGTESPMLFYIAGSLWFWIGFLILLPVLTMRLLSEEKRSGTIEMLLTAPVTEAEVVLGKYFAALTFYPLLWMPSAIFLIVIYRQASFDYWPVLACYIGVMSMGAMFVAIGLFFSSLTRNQIIAAITTAATLVLLFAFYWLQAASQYSAGWTKWSGAFQYMAVLSQLIELAQGKMDVKYIALHLSVAVFMLFLTIRLLEARKGQ